MVSVVAAGGKGWVLPRLCMAGLEICRNYPKILMDCEGVRVGGSGVSG